MTFDTSQLVCRARFLFVVIHDLMSDVVKDRIERIGGYTLALRFLKKIRSMMAKAPR